MVKTTLKEVWKNREDTAVIWVMKVPVSSCHEHKLQSAIYDSYENWEIVLDIQVIIVAFTDVHRIFYAFSTHFLCIFYAYIRRKSDKYP